MLFRFEPRLASSSLKSPLRIAWRVGAREARARVDLLPLHFEGDEEEQLVRFFV